MVIDSDMVYTESKLNNMFKTRSCLSDDDCNFFDCKSNCNNLTGFCTSRTNDNIDVKLFILFHFIIFKFRYFVKKFLIIYWIQNNLINIFQLVITKL